LADQPQHPVGLFELARLAEARGEMDRARVLYQQFLEVAPEQMGPQRSHAIAALGL